MTIEGNEQMAMDAAMDDENTGSVLQTLGWSLLIFAAIPAVWIFTGWRAGSWFWFWIVLGLGVIGSALIAAGTLYRTKAARDFAAVAMTIQSRSVPSLTAAELQRPREDEGDVRRAA